MPSLPAIDLDALVSRLVQLLRTPSPTGDTEDALCQQFLHFVIHFHPEGCGDRGPCRAAQAMRQAPRVPSRAMWTPWAPS